MSQTVLENTSNHTEQVDSVSTSTNGSFELTEHNPVYGTEIIDMDDEVAANEIRAKRADAYEEAKKEYEKKGRDEIDEAAFTRFMNADFTNRDKVSVKRRDNIQSQFDIEKKTNIPPAAEAVGDMAVSSQVKKDQI